MKTWDVKLDNVWTYRVTASNPADALTQAVKLMTDGGLLFNTATLLSVTIDRVKS